MEVKKMPNSSSGRKQPTAVSRMKQDYMRLKRDPLPYITAEPLPNNILEWHYVVKGPEDSPYYGGYYHGTLLFPREFPFKPPSIYMLTPNGRFKTNTRLCLSISDFHPDTWNPTWCVGTILTGLLSFMLESTATLGSIETTNYEKQQLAKKSLAFNLKNPHFVELFPEICEEINKRLQTEKEQKLKALNAAANGTIANGTNGLKATLNGGGMVGVGGVRARLAANGTTANVNDINGGTAADPNSAKSLSNSYLNWQSNIIIIICFAIFVLVVNYVFKNINQE
ncbi:ubiquitin-conjugating enzyme E2 J2 [Lucilia cuprina]|uniref:ubiquitin-conjugating enzyme E2 J2 n=1 Tax=Lucilia cuprina TaxID=7375 RepID=UPI001F050A37|nr:ubiquitin-conjugating enzyme E2 J2 [Lucilia cuprina]XP_023291497.2 ubiquitin-conjugating enzyme E2 J2 [Lucilia cuprina]